MKPLVRSLASFALSPGAHLLLSVLVERRRVSRHTEYPAVIVGDTALAVAAGLAASAAQDDDARGGRGTARMAWGTTAVAFGAWQLRREIRLGIYDRHVAFGPTKLWHQFVIYPVLGTVVGEALQDGTKATVRPESTHGQKRAVLAAWACVGLWGLLVVEAWLKPRQCHGTWPTRKRNLAETEKSVGSVRESAIP